MGDLVSFSRAASAPATTGHMKVLEDAESQAARQLKKAETAHGEAHAVYERDLRELWSAEIDRWPAAFRAPARERLAELVAELGSDAGGQIRRCRAGERCQGSWRRTPADHVSGLIREILHLGAKLRGYRVKGNAGWVTRERVHLPRLKSELLGAMWVYGYRVVPTDARPKR